MTHASRPASSCREPKVPRSLGTLAADLVACAHPVGSHVRVAIDPAGDGAAATWCAACGALHARGGAMPAWRSPSLALRLTRKAFEDVVLLLHAVVQLAQLARGHEAEGWLRSASPLFVRTVRASLAELARLPVVRDVDRLEAAIAAMPPVRILS